MRSCRQYKASRYLLHMLQLVQELGVGVPVLQAGLLLGGCSLGLEQLLQVLRAAHHLLSSRHTCMHEMPSQPVLYLQPIDQEQGVKCKNSQQQVPSSRACACAISQLKVSGMSHLQSRQPSPRGWGRACCSWACPG